MTLASRPRLALRLCLGGILLAGCARPARPHPEGQGRAFQFTYQTTIADLPDAARHIRVWVPLAKTRDNQRIRSRRIHTAHPYEIHEEPTYGNDMLALALAAPVPRAVTVSIEYAVEVSEERPTPRRLSGLPVAGTVASADELSLALRDEPLMVINEVTTRLARQAVAGRRGELAKARAIYDAVIQRMQYDKATPGWGRGDTLRACQLGRGNCTDFHSLFISMARSVGIPARFVMGAPIPEDAPDGTVPGYHCWAEFYSPQHGWVPVDASEAWKQPERRDYYFGTRDPNRILLSVGRNLQLVPAQAGGPVNFLVYPYVEVDGQPFGGHVETRFQFRDHQQREGT
ncbi:MAG: transglutaminase domain-containing protein [Candidatus Omnitrophica bacterium]|nr:transglutaminase domain-containing protein [Candidatus Omnitrophota bacterium]